MSVDNTVLARTQLSTELTTTFSSTDKLIHIFTLMASFTDCD